MKFPLSYSAGGERERGPRVGWPAQLATLASKFQLWRLHEKERLTRPKNQLKVIS